MSSYGFGFQYFCNECRIRKYIIAANFDFLHMSGSTLATICCPVMDISPFRPASLAATVTSDNVLYRHGYV